MEIVKEKLRVSFMKIMNCKQIKLFGALIFKFNTRILDNPELTACVYFDGKTPNIIFGKSLLERMTINQITFVMLHEMLHFINGHHHRGLRLDKVIGNLAADHVVNEVLLKDLGLVEIENDNGETSRTRNVIGDVCEQCKEPEPFVVPELLGKKNMTYEGVYEWLMKNKVTYELMPSGSGAQGDGNGGESKGNKSNKYKIKLPGQEAKEYSSDISNDGDGDSSDKEIEKFSKDMSDKLKDDIRGIINASQNSDLTRGMEGGNILEHIKELTKVIIPWDELLEVAIKNHVIPSFENKSWRNPMKRLRAHGFFLPGIGTDKTASKMVVIIDTSGSIGSDDLSKFLSICRDSLIHFDEVTFIQHDYRLQKITTVDKDNIDFGINEVSKFSGRGGTSHTEVFEHIEEEIWKEDNDVGLVIMLTDFYSDIEENWQSGRFKWIEDYPVKIVMNHNDEKMVPKYIDPHPITIKLIS